MLPSYTRILSGAHPKRTGSADEEVPSPDSSSQPEEYHPRAVPPILAPPPPVTKRNFRTGDKRVLQEETWTFLFSDINCGPNGTLARDEVVQRLQTARLTNDRTFLKRVHQHVDIPFTDDIFLDDVFRTPSFAGGSQVTFGGFRTDLAISWWRQKAKQLEMKLANTMHDIQSFQPRREGMEVEDALKAVRETSEREKRAADMVQELQKELEATRRLSEERDKRNSEMVQKLRTEFGGQLRNAEARCQELEVQVEQYKRESEDALNKAQAEREASKLQATEYRTRFKDQQVTIKAELSALYDDRLLKANQKIVVLQMALDEANGNYPIFKEKVSPMRMQRGSDGF